jgi:hypothetical protein
MDKVINGGEPVVELTNETPPRQVQPRNDRLVAVVDSLVEKILARP